MSKRDPIIISRTVVPEMWNHVTLLGLSPLVQVKTIVIVTNALVATTNRDNMMSVTATTAAVPVVITVMIKEVVVIAAGVGRLINGVMIGADVEQ